MNMPCYITRASWKSLPGISVDKDPEVKFTLLTDIISVFKTLKMEALQMPLQHTIPKHSKEWNQPGLQGVDFWKYKNVGLFPSCLMVREVGDLTSIVACPNSGGDCLVFEIKISQCYSHMWSGYVNIFVLLFSVTMRSARGRPSSEYWCRIPLLPR